jgi:recombination protein RecA
MARKKSTEESFSSVDDFMGSIKKNYGDDFVEDTKDAKPVSFQTTNMVGLDNIMGGGRPKGRMIEIYGKESSGKTSLALQMIGVCQKLGGTAMLIDAEHVYDPKWCEKFKIDNETLNVVRADHAEQYFDILIQASKSGLFDIIVVDSIASFSPKEEVEAETGKAQMALLARVMSKGMRKLVRHVHKTNTTVVFINQTRSKVGLVFGNPETTTGGNALPFFASIRCEVKAVEKKDTYIKQKIKCIKNKVAPPFRECTQILSFDTGYNVYEDLLNCCLDFGVIEKSGRMFYFDDEKIASSKNDCLLVLKKDKNLRISLKKAVKKAYSNHEWEVPEDD